MIRALIHHAAGAALVVTSMGLDRLVIVGLILAGATFLSAVGKIDGAAAVGLYAATLGYVFGKAPTMGTDQRTEAG